MSTFGVKKKLPRSLPAFWNPYRYRSASCLSNFAAKQAQIRLLMSFKKQVVLVRQNVESFDEFKSSAPEFENDLLGGELHRWWRPDRQVLLIEIDYYDPSTHLHRLCHLGVISGAVVDVVQFIAKENRVHLGRWKARIIRSGQNRFEVWQADGP